MGEVAGAGRVRFVDPLGVQRGLKAADFLMLAIASLGVFLGSSLLIPGNAASLIGFLVLEVALGSVLMMSWVGLYGLDMLLDPRRGIASALLVTAGLGAIVFVATHLGLVALEPWWLAGWLALCAVHFTSTRLAAYFWAKPWAMAGKFRRRVAVVGWGQDAEIAVGLLRGADPHRIEVVGLFDDRGSRKGSGVGDMADLATAAKAGSIDLVIVAIPFAIEHRLLQTLRQLWPLPVDVRIAGQASQLKLSPRAYGYLGRLPLLSVFDRPLRGRRRAKNVLDRTLAGLLLALLLPVLALAALALRLEGQGAVLVKEMALGFDGAAIAVYRFGCGAKPASWLGRGLQSLGLDRVPQLLNVLKGELSLVGPRLHAAGAAPAADGSLGSLYRQVIDGYFARHHIKPGITGWAQINGSPGGVQMLERTAKHDLEYVDRWSLLFDLYILFKAPFSLLRKPSGV